MSQQTTSEAYLKDGRNRPCFICNLPIGTDAMVIMRPTDQVNVTERAMHARCVNGAQTKKDL